MTERLDLQCRCGWRGMFGQDQRGLTLDCPECGRPFLVTDDAPEFSNRNVGSNDFTFADEEGWEEESPLPTPASRRAVPSQRSPVPPSRRRARVEVRRMKRSSGPLPYVFLGVVGVALAGGGFFARANREREIEAARGVADRIVRLLSTGKITAASQQFLSDAPAEELGDQIEDLRKESGDGAFQFIGTRFPEGTFSVPDRVTASYDWAGKQGGARLTLILTRQGEEWLVSESHLRALTEAEQPGR